MTKLLLSFGIKCCIIIYPLRVRKRILFFKILLLFLKFFQLIFKKRINRLQNRSWKTNVFSLFCGFLFHCSDKLYKLAKKIKDTRILIIASILPTKDNMWGSINATIARTKKNRARVRSPEKPTLPDLYQLKFL